MQGIGGIGKGKYVFVCVCHRGAACTHASIFSVCAPNHVRDQPSIAVCPNPVRYQLTVPLSSDSETMSSATASKDDTKENCLGSNHNATRSLQPRPLSRGGSSIATATTARLPYRTIFAVLTWDSVLIYDTVHDQPLAVVRGIHYAHLVDAAWTADGRQLLVCSTDGYITILRFDAGELGAPYLEPLSNQLSLTTAASPSASTAGILLVNAMSTKTSGSADEIGVRLPPCEPGPVAVHCPPAKRAKTRITPTLVAANSNDISHGTMNTNTNGNSVATTSASVKPMGTAVGAGTMDYSLHKRTASEATLAVDKLSLVDVEAMDHATGEGTLHVTKKPKKRIQPTLMSVS
jgi:hypothetical protein